jgi:hypothetical protein
MGNTTTYPMRGANRTLTGTTETLLPPGLATATTGLRTSLGGCRATASACQLSCDHLVEDVEVGLDAEDLFVELDVTTWLSFRGEKRCFEINHETSPPP